MENRGESSSEEYTADEKARHIVRNRMSALFEIGLGSIYAIGGAYGLFLALASTGALLPALAVGVIGLGLVFVRVGVKHFNEVSRMKGDPELLKREMDLDRMRALYDF